MPYDPNKYVRTKLRREEKAAKKKNRARNLAASADTTALPRPCQKPENLPVDGMERFWDQLREHTREICITAEAMESRRQELWARSGGRCEGCRMPVQYDGLRGFHLHHIFGKGAGKRCDCLECIQALCRNTFMTDGTIRPGCHTKVHRIGILDGPYIREAGE